MAIPADAVGPAPGWLRDRGFDLSFVVGIAALALASGWLVVREPALFVPVFFADLWLLGYHHVVATFTRLCFDRDSFRAHRLLVLGLPPLVLAAVAAAAFGIGLWTLASVYLYWQWFHYARQSWGISQVYRRKSGGLVADHPVAARLAFYLLPLWGILARSQQDPGVFLGLELRVVPVPAVAVDLAAAAALASLAWWGASRLGLWWRGRLPVAHTLYMACHFAIFYVAYIGIEDIDRGWLVVNIWHNAQYVVFVWMFNNNRFKAGLDARARFLSALSQERASWRYFGVSLGLSTAAYLAIGHGVALLVPAVVIHQSVNFHHYIVDGLIWKIRRKPLQRTLGIAS